MRSRLLIFIAAAVLAAGCSRESTPPAESAAWPDADQASTTAPAAEYDSLSYAEPGKVRIEALELELELSFDQKELAGSATYRLDWRDPAATELVLDSRDLVIGQVQAERPDGTWAHLEYTLAEAVEPLGSKLSIEAPGQPQRIRVSYHTSPEASGLQWLTPAMTQGGKQPFMFSQSQQIHARSWVPLQDTPRVRFTYTAHVTSPENAMVLMSADNDPGAERDGDYRFEMPQPIPSYLLAIAAGDLVFEPISERSGVWAEPAMVEKAAAEFADTERMIQVAEKLYGPYRWGRYDMLVLPPSFPYGGMENPRLSFITPTVIVGDKSMVALIAHELSHSWSGNLVTFSTPKDAWLNEGVTSYVENRIVEALYGKELADMEFVIARNELRESLADMPEQARALAVRPEVRVEAGDPLSEVAYDKGAWLLAFLEERFGRAAFDEFLRGYFEHFAFQSIPTTRFIEYAQANLLDEYPGKMTREELEEWIYGTTIPASAPRIVSEPLQAVDAVREAWLADGTLPDSSVTEAWSTQEWLHFLDGLPKTLGEEQLTALDEAYAFTGTANGEIAMRWYPLTVRSGYAHANGAMAAFLKKIGRRKLIMPTYEALVKTPEGLALAKQVLADARAGYHPITTSSVEEVIADAEGEAAAVGAGAH
jgi:aminopeptidase N